jgi:hypothetical protein
MGLGPGDTVIAGSSASLPQPIGTLPEIYKKIYLLRKDIV